MNPYKTKVSQDEDDVKPIGLIAPNWALRLRILMGSRSFKYRQQHTAGFTENNIAGADPVGAHPARAPLELEKSMIFFA